MAREANTPFFDSDGDNTAQAARTTDGRIHHIHVVNSNTVDAYLQLFAAAAASVTVGTTAPNLSFLVPAGNGTDAGAYDASFPGGIYFATAITYACTTTPTGNGDPTTGLTVNMVLGGP